MFCLIRNLIDPQHLAAILLEGRQFLDYRKGHHFHLGHDQSVVGTTTNGHPPVGNRCFSNPFGVNNHIFNITTQQCLFRVVPGLLTFLVQVVDCTPALI